MANVLPSLSKITRTSLLLGLGFLFLIATFSCSSGEDRQDNGLALMQQIVQPLKDAIKKYKEFWGDDDDTEGDLESFNEYATEIKAHKEKVKDHPEDTQAYLDLAEAIDFQELYNAEASEKTQRAAYLEMIRWLTTAIKNLPDNKELYKKRAGVYADNQQYPNALADYTYVIKLYPQDGDTFSSRGRAYEKMGLEKEAQQDFDAYTKIQPQTAQQYHTRGLFYYFRDHFDLAEPDFSKSIDLEPNKDSGYLFRAEIYFTQNRYDDSTADYKKILDLDSFLTGFGLSRTGMNYYYQGNYKMAEKVLEKALRQDPSLDTVAWWYLSRQKQGKTSKAALEHIANHFGDEHLEGAVIHFFLDKVSLEELLKKKRDPTGITADHNTSMALYYAGQYDLMRGDVVKARAKFEQSIQESEEPYNPGRLFSEKELARLQSDNPSDPNDQR